jgi:hypothetical protein
MLHATVHTKKHAPFLRHLPVSGYVTRRLLLIALAALVILATSASARTVLSDGFNRTTVSSKTWHISTWIGDGDGTYVGRTQFRVTQNSPLPQESGGNASITVQTFNPAGFSMYGTDLISNRSFLPNVGLHITVRARMGTRQRGIVGGIFLYGLKPNGANHDEIDFELVSNHPGRVLTNVYGNEPLGVGRPVSVPYNSGTITSYHKYEVWWLRGRVSWYVDGRRVRTVASGVPRGPMRLHLNMWVPDNSWPYAYNVGIEPTSSSSANGSFSMFVDLAKVVLS